MVDTLEPIELQLMPTPDQRRHNRDIQDAINRLVRAHRKIAVAAGTTDAGTKGPTGDKGPRGDPGRNGVDGSDGLPGQDGQDGLDGLNGLDGNPGPDGDKGPAGDKGPTGDKSPTGDKGPTGDAGSGGSGGGGPAGGPGDFSFDFRSLGNIGTGWNNTSGYVVDIDGLYNAGGGYYLLQDAEDVLDAWTEIEVVDVQASVNIGIMVRASGGERYLYFRLYATTVVVLEKTAGGGYDTLGTFYYPRTGGFQTILNVYNTTPRKIGVILQGDRWSLTFDGAVFAQGTTVLMDSGKTGIYNSGTARIRSIRTVSGPAMVAELKYLPRTGGYIDGDLHISGQISGGTDSDRAPLDIISGNGEWWFSRGAADQTPGLCVAASTGKAAALLCGASGTGFSFDGSGTFVLMSDTRTAIDTDQAGNGTAELFISLLKNFGIGNTNPLSKFHVSGDIRSTSMVLQSPDGTWYRYTPANDGTLVASAA